MAYLTFLLQLVPNFIFLLSRLLLEHVYFILVSWNIWVYFIYFYTGVIIPRTGITLSGVWSEGAFLNVTKNSCKTIPPDPFTNYEYTIWLMQLLLCTLRILQTPMDMERKGRGGVKISFLCSPRLHLFDQKQNKTVILWNIISIKNVFFYFYSTLKCIPLMQSYFFISHYSFIQSSVWHDASEIILIFWFIISIIPSYIISIILLLI